MSHIASLSLNATVSLKALPPVSQVVHEETEHDVEWWEDEKELQRVIRMYCESSKT